MSPTAKSQAELLRKQRRQEKVVCQYIRTAPDWLITAGCGEKSEHDTLHRVYPKMKIVGIEASMLRYQRTLLGFPGLYLPYALWDRQEDVTLFRTTEDAGDKDPPSAYAVGGRQFQEVVPGITLDWLDGMIGPLHNVLFWMDIEGAELRALKGGIRMLKSHRIRWINTEVRMHPKRKDLVSEAQLTAFLKKLGYEVALRYAIHANHCDVIYRVKGD